MDSSSVQEKLSIDIILPNDKLNSKLPPKAKFSRKDDILFHIFFFLLGVCHFLPTSFIASANNFWLFKFRDVDDKTNLPENRSFLQKNFGSASMIANVIPVLALGIFNIVYANKFKIMNRLMLTNGAVFFSFIFFTISTKVNTDSYQVEFFSIAMLIFAIISGAFTVNMVASMNLYTRFPHKYMKTAFVGEGASGIIGSGLNVIAVAIFHGVLKHATLLYFVCGTSVIGSTFLMSIIVSRNRAFIDCVESVQSSEKVPTINELKSALKRIRFTILMITFVFVTSAATHPAISSLVVSEIDPEKSHWAKDYFSPVLTFLLTDTTSLLGSMAFSYIPLNIPDHILLILAGLVTIVIGPAVWMCNAQPRKHMPILFKHDYQYGIIVSFSTFAVAYFYNASFMDIAITIPDPNEADLAYTVFGLCANTLQTITSPIGIFIVNVL